jgi:uncharacterized protein involved in outer membrane biogenesis
LRVFLTSTAILLIAVLTAALVGPYFIDWSQHRATIEAQLSRAVGLPVKLAGPIKAALLPTPYVILGDLSIDDGKGDPILSCRRVRLELALAPLVHGEWRFTDATIERARIELQRSASGAIQLPPLTVAMAPESIGLDSIAFRDTTIELASTDGAAPMVIEGLELTANADSLRGPFRGSGRAEGAGRPFAFHFATGALKGDALPIKFVADFGAALNAEFDGALSAGRGTPLSYLGAAALSGASGATPWRLSGALNADLNGAKIEQMEARLGAEDERALALQGSAEARFGATPRISATLAAKELNLDMRLRDKGADSAPPKRAAEALAALFSGTGAERGPPLPISVKIDTPAIILGGDTVGDASLEAFAAPGAPVSIRLQASPPGGRLSASGDIELGPAAHFKGPISVSIDEVSRLRDWLSQDDPELRARLAVIADALPYRSASLVGDVDISGASFATRDITLTLARSVLKGAAAFTAARGADRARLFADLKTDALDLDALPNVLAGGQVLGDIDLSVALEAGASRIAHLGEGAIETGSFALRLNKNGDDVTIDHLSVAIGGATLEATGALKGGERWLNIDLDAERLQDFALLTRRIAPGPISNALVERAGPLSPAKLGFTAKASGPVRDSLWTPDSLVVRGVVGATRVNAIVDRAASSGGLSANLSLDAPEVSALLRQLGVPALPLTGLGRGAVNARADGDWSKGFSGEATASLAGAELSWSGQIFGVDSRLQGSVKLKAANVTPLLASLGIAAQDARQGAAADLSAGVAWRADDIALSRLKGVFGRASVLGDLVYRRNAADGASDAASAQVDGALSMDRLALDELASLALGPSQPPKPGAVWSEAKFSPALANPPTTAIALKIGALELTSDLVARDTSLTLKVRPGLIGFDDLAMHLAGGTASGAATLRRDGANAALSGKIAFDSIAIDRPGFAAGLAGSLDFASTGRSPAGLVAGLAGSGALKLNGALVRRLDPDALTRIMAIAQRPDFDIEQIDLPRLVGRELDRHALQVGDASAPATLTAGVVRAGPFAAQRAGGDASAEIGFDLRSLSLDVQVAVNERQAPKFWSGAPPAISVAVRGPPDALSRDIDAAALANGLEAQAIARESARIADIEADIRERAAFNRVLKASRSMRQRELDLEAYAADQARLKSEGDRRRVEVQLLKASEEAQKAAEEARRAADEARKAQEEAHKANEIAPPLPADAAPSSAPSAIFAPAAAAPSPPTPPPRPSRPSDTSPSGIY